MTGMQFYVLAPKLLAMLGKENRLNFAFFGPI
jgi:hypothetical protein